MAWRFGCPHLYWTKIFLTDCKFYMNYLTIKNCDKTLRKNILKFCWRRFDDYNLAKWLEERLKPLFVNEFTITDAIRFSEEIRNSPTGEDDMLVSSHVTALFTNVPLNETIDILVEKAFPDDWFNQTYDLNLQKCQLTKLLEIATTNQLFQFNGQLYKQIDGVAMGSPLGPLNGQWFPLPSWRKAHSRWCDAQLLLDIRWWCLGQNAQHRCCSWFSHHSL